MEAKLQKKIIKFLKDNYCYVLKTRPMPGIPVGCPDIVALKGDKWCVIEVKASEKAPWRPGQQATLNYLGKGNRHVYHAYPENWPEIQQLLIDHFL